MGIIFKGRNYEMLFQNEIVEKNIINKFICINI